MGFFKKLSTIFKNSKKETSISWDIKLENENIVLTSNVDLLELDEIVSLINIYNIERINNSLFFPYEEIYDLYYDENNIEIEDYKKFNLPDLFKGFLKIENKNNFLQDKEVIYSFEFEGINGRYQIEKGNILRITLSDEYKVIPKKVYEIIKKVRDYNKDSAKKTDISCQFEMLKFIKDYSNDVDLILNKRLSEEETPIVIDKISIDLKDDGEVLEIFPRLSEDDNINSELLNKIYSYEEAKELYSANIGNKKVKFIIKNKDSMKKIIENRYHSGEKRLDVIKGNNEIFEDENIDISVFGPRVTGIGYLNYRSYSITSNTSDIEWLDKEIPHFYADSEKVILRPEDKAKLEEKLQEMNINNQEKAEMSFTTEDGNKANIILTKDDIKNEIEKINTCIKAPNEITKKQVIADIISDYDKYEDKPYIEYEGKYIKNYGKEAFEEQFKNLEEQQNNKSEKKKDQTLLIAENIDAEEYMEDIKENLKLNKVEVPLGLKNEISLFDYQKEALFKLQNLYLSSKRNGFLLCDDMGLGKTLQLLSLLGWLKDKNELSPALIVAPTSLLNNWDNEDGNGEVQKFFKKGYFNIEKIRGKVTDDYIEKLKKMDIVFITYESLRINNIKLGTINWKVMICDEAQKIKNPKTLVTVSAKGQNANFKIICSATPIENSLIDLWNLVDYSKPGLLGSLKNFQGNYIKRIENASYEELQNINDELYNQIEKFYIRREKDILPKSLPNKKIKIYKKKANKFELEIINRLQSTEDSMLALIQKMLAVSNHVDIIGENDIKEIDINTLIEKSSKLQTLHNILIDIKEKDEKVLIFTRSIKMQQIIYNAINHWFNISAKIVNGTISNLEKRTRIIDEFRNSKGFNAIILSPEVAGFGITLTEANHVIHYTRLWNPAKEDQATDRVYRIGQEKEVTVHYPILSFSKDCIEEYNNAKEYVELNTEIEDNYLSPEEKLNILLARKKNMLLNFFLAVDKSELGEKDFLSFDNSKEKEIKSINLYDIENGIIDAFEFEALIGVLYSKLGYESFVTSKSNDNGVDVICKNEEEILFIQCKKTQKINNKDSIKELLYAKDTYERNIGIKNIKLIIVTNSTEILKSITENTSVEVIDGYKLETLLSKYHIFKDEVDIKNNDRYSFERLKLELKN